MSDKIKIKYLTGVCPNCGANQFHFDEKEQTFVCEFCNTEVYGVQEEKKKPEPVHTKPVPEVRLEREPLRCNPIEETDDERDEKLREQLKNFAFRCMIGLIVITIAMFLGNMEGKMPTPSVLTGDALKAYMLLFRIARLLIFFCGVGSVITSSFKFMLGYIRGFKDGVQ